MHPVWIIVRDFWGILCEMAPYLLFGFLFAGVLSVLISPSTVERHLGGRGVGPIFKSALFGVPLPLCSCGVIPVSASLRNHGASRAATTSFLLSTPQTGVDSIMVTYSLLGPVFAIFRPVAAFVSGLIGGGAVAIADTSEMRETAAVQTCKDECCSAERGGPVARMLRYGFLTLPRDIAGSLLVGLAVAGVISALVPNDYFGHVLGGGLPGMLAMMALGIPVYVCATASVPMAAALVAKGISPGAALVFLMTGPATNAATIATVWRVMGKRTAVIYLATVASTALVFGFLLDYVFRVTGTPSAMYHVELLPVWFKTVCAVALLAIMIAAGLPRSRATAITSPEEQLPHMDLETATIEIDGMSCNHCVQTVRRAIEECSGVESVDVTLKPPRAVIRGRSLSVEAMRRRIEGLGYDVTSATGLGRDGDTR